jgi:hypothetical protein
LFAAIAPILALLSRGNKKTSAHRIELAIDRALDHVHGQLGLGAKLDLVGEAKAGGAAITIEVDEGEGATTDDAPCDRRVEVAISYRT